MLATVGRCIDLVGSLLDSYFTSCSTDVQKWVTDFGNCQRRVAVYEASWLNNLQCNPQSNVLDHTSQLLQSVTEHICKMHSATCVKYMRTGKSSEYKHARHHRESQRVPCHDPNSDVTCHESMTGLVMRMPLRRS